MVSEVGLYLYLFNKENIWSNPHASSHPDKYNNSVNRIISKRRGERRSKERFFNLSSSTVVFPHSYKNYSVSTRNPATPSNSTYRINSSTRNTTTTRLIPCRLHPATVPRVSKHSTRQNKASSNSTRQKQHSRRQAASTQSLQQLPGQSSTLQDFTRIHSKGLSIVCLCNTKVSVFQLTYSCFRIIS